MKTIKDVGVRVLMLLALFTLHCSFISSAHAEYALPYLAFETTDGEVLSVAVEGLTFTLDDATLTATDSEGAAYTFALSSLSKMYFTDEITGIQPLASTSQEAVEAYTTQARLGEAELMLLDGGISVEATVVGGHVMIS